MGNTANEEYSTKQLRRVLGKKELISMGIGQIIGSGVFSLTGVAIGYTGRSVIFAFLFGALEISAVAVQITGVPSQIAMMIQGCIMLFVIAGEFFNRYKIVVNKKVLKKQEGGETA